MQIDNYALLKDYGIDTTEAGDFVHFVRDADGNRLERRVGCLGPGAANAAASDEQQRD